MNSPYHQALEWIDRQPDSAGAHGLAKLILSLWNGNNAFSLRECLESLDGAQLLLAMHIIKYFAHRGEDAELRDVGRKVCELFPRVWEVGQAAHSAKTALLQPSSAPQPPPG